MRRRSIRLLGVILSAALTATTLSVVSPPPAVADSVPSTLLPTVPSVPVTPPGRDTPDTKDETSPGALSGDQPARASTLPGAGDYGATSLSASATWNVSAQTGTFSWSYPLRVPPAPGGQQPAVALSYSSSAVDGLTSATNNQASWIGDGWNLWPGFIERSYGGCADDLGGGADKPHDQCWRTDNATMSLAGGGSQLIRDDATGVWRPKADDGSRIEQLFDVPNGDDNGEHWKVTTADGTQYFFGSRPEANSAWTVPVFGDDAGEPCHKDTFATSWCDQGYRWNLDKVVDRHGNMMVYFYDTELNHYGRNKNEAAARYVRGGTLNRVEYGLRSDDPAVQPTGRLSFEVADRCVKDSDCTWAKPDNLPDVPLKLNCDGGSCPDQYGPSFWTTKHLVKIKAEVRGPAGFDLVDSWSLRHEFPEPGDREKPALWLKGITHTGHRGDGPDIILPEVVFDGVRKPNRVFGADGYAALIRFRLHAITSESGGITIINYADPDCSATSKPANPETNTMRCFPAHWAAKDSPERTDYFHKYVVAQVSSSDRVAGSATQEVHYEYVGGAAWHFDESELTKEEKKTWNSFRGFGRVVIREGSGQDGSKSKTEQVFYRGMHGDKLPGGGTRTVWVEDSAGGKVPDEDWLDGTQRESILYNGDGGAVVSKTISEPHWFGPTATRAQYKAYRVRPGVTRDYIAVAAGGWRETRKENAYYDNGLPKTVNDLGDLSTPADDRCTTTEYAPNTSAWLMSYPSRVQSVSVHCGATPVYPGHALSDSKFFYDNQAHGVPPVRGDVTRTEVLKDRQATGPVHTLAGTAVFDSTGRRIEMANPFGKITKMTFTPAVGGPVTESTIVNPLGHKATTKFDGATGQPTMSTDPNGRVIETTYDVLGRRSAVWMAERPRAENPEPSEKFAYAIRNDGAPVVTTSTVGPNGRYNHRKVIFDGLLRERQTQSSAPGGGRLLTNVRFDSHGRASTSTTPYYNTDPVGDEFVLPMDNEVPGMNRIEVDGAGRKTADVFLGRGMEKWRTTFAHGGDRVHITPPLGGTATTTVTDARGQTVELRQYRGATPTGEFEATRYGYSAAGLLTSVTDAAGNVWDNKYDLLGRRYSETDPDKGTTTHTYDKANRLVSTKDARNVTLAYAYDALDRKTALHKDSLYGTKLASWTYDDPAAAGIGQLSTSTRHIGGHAYTTKVVRYDARYRPLTVGVTVPSVPTEPELAGTYVTNLLYNPDGSLQQEALPGLTAALPAETVTHTYTDLGLASETSGGWGGRTDNYAHLTEHTRYGETQRLHLGPKDGPGRVWLSSYYDEHTRRLQREVVDAEIPSPNLADINYTHDPAGNITSIADRQLEAPADTQCFRHDHLHRLTEAWTPTSGCAADPSVGTLGGPAPYWQSFTYDTTGNRLTEIAHAADGDTLRAYTNAPTGHRLQSVKTTKPDGATVLDQFDYHANGAAKTRAVAGRVQTLDWDAEARLAKATENGNATEYVHSADGDRIIHRAPDAVTLYLGAQEVRLDRTTRVKTATRHYTHDGRVIAVRDSSGLSWLGTDRQGTAQVAVRATDLTVAKRRQLPFGAARGPAAAIPGERGFVGGTADRSTGLIRLGVREYDPAIGRFVSVDAVLDTSDPQQMHGYSYSVNSPITYSDPTGYKQCSDDDCSEWEDSQGNLHGRPAAPAPPSAPPAQSTPSDWDTSEPGWWDTPEPGWWDDDWSDIDDIAEPDIDDIADPDLFDTFNPFGGPAKPKNRLQKFWEWLPVPSISTCRGVQVSAAHVGLGAEGCLSFDIKTGLYVNYALKTFATEQRDPGIALSNSTKVSFLESAADTNSGVEKYTQGSTDCYRGIVECTAGHTVNTEGKVNVFIEVGTGVGDVGSFHEGVSYGDNRRLIKFPWSP